MSLPDHASVAAPAPILSWGDGDVARLMRSRDWSTSPLGWPETWPQTLRNAVSLILHSKFPMYVAWGPKLAYLYNDAYAGIIGAKHPAALGRPLSEVWPEMWDQISPAVARNFAGKATFHENFPTTVSRNGYSEQAYFTFSFSPLWDDDGAVAGMLCVISETSKQVLNDQRLGFLIELGDRLRELSDPVEIALCAAEMMGRNVQAARAGYGEVDEAEEIVSVPADWTDGRVGSLAGEARMLDAFGPAVIAELHAGRTLIVDDCLTDPRAGETYASTWNSIGTRSLIVVPLIKEDRLRAIFYLHEPQPRRWSEAEAILARDVAERTWDAVQRSRAEIALRASAARLRLAVDAGRMAVWEHVTATDSVTASPELNRVLGYAVGITLDMGELRKRYYPGDRERLTTAALEALKRGEHFFETEYRFYRPDGVLRWFLMRAEMLLDAAGMPIRTVGVILDITDRKEAEEALREREAELRAALEAGSLAIFDFDHIKGRMNPSARLSELYGYPPDHVLSIADIRARYHPDDVEKIWSKRQYDGEDTSIRHFDWTLRLLLPGGVIRWVNGLGEYIRDEAGRILRSRGVIMDITERKRWEEHQQLLINELNHRVKNTLATVQSIAAQTLRNADSMEEARLALEARLFALSRAHDVLTRENWEGAGLIEIVLQALAPYRHERENRLHVQGPDIRLSPRMAMAIAMALQELATNAVKYGALSNAVGGVRIAWDLKEVDGISRLYMEWTESGGPAVSPPKRRGFGTRLIERSLAQDLNGFVKLEFSESGLICTVDAPLTSDEFPDALPRQ
ncbi:MAG: PAS domain-containing protein [Pseudomonadota bacterium]|nr:PAS domain-containing protein [Pseudomonadota bacterium]